MSKKRFLTLKEIVLFGLFPAIIFAAQQAMAALPNVHMTGMFIMLMTLLFRAKALIPLYIYVLMMGLYGGFNLWWFPYLYVWTVLWGMTMLIPKKIPDRIAAFVYPAVCGLHGFLYGTIWALSQPLLMGFDFKATVGWILGGLPFDAVHGTGNLVMGTLILPLYKALQQFAHEKTEKK